MPEDSPAKKPGEKSLSEAFLAQHKSWKLRTWDPHVRAVAATIKVVPTAVQGQPFYNEPGGWEKFKKGVASDTSIRSRFSHVLQDKVVEYRTTLTSDKSEEKESTVDSIDATLKDQQLPGLQNMIGRGGIGLLNRAEEIYKNPYTGMLLDGVSFVQSEGFTASDRKRLESHSNVRALKDALEKLQEQWKQTPVGMWFDENSSQIILVGKILVGLGGPYGLYRWYMSGSNIDLPVVGELSKKLEGTKIDREMGEVTFNGEVTKFNPKEKQLGTKLTFSEKTKGLKVGWTTSGVLDGQTGTVKTGLNFQQTVAKNWNLNYGFAGGASKKDYVWNARGPTDTSQTLVEPVYDLDLSVSYSGSDIKFELWGNRSFADNKHTDEVGMQLGGRGRLGRNPYSVTGGFSMDNKNDNNSFRPTKGKLIFTMDL